MEWIEHHSIDHTLTFIHWLLILLLLLTLTIMTQPPEQNSVAVAGGVKFHRKTSVLDSLFTKLQAFRPAALLKKSPTKVFSCEIWEIVKNTCFEEHLWTTDYMYWLLHLYWFWQFTTVHVFHFHFQFTPSLMRNYSNITNDVWGGFFWWSIWLNKIFSFWNLKISFTEMFHESFKKQFNWNSMLRYTMKLTLN